MISIFNLLDKRFSDAKTITDAIGKTIECPSVAYTTYLKSSAAIGAGVLAAGILAGGVGGVLVIPIYSGLKKLWQSISKKIRAKHKRQEKEVLLKEIIVKQQAIINKLNEQNKYNQSEIQNLKEALNALNEVQSAIDADFGLA